MDVSNITYIIGISILMSIVWYAPSIESAKAFATMLVLGQFILLYKYGRQLQDKL